MNLVKSIEPAIDPGNRITFLLDWEITLKCNLDCSYCSSGPDGYHDNAQPHPELEQCVRTIDFMFEYADLYMQYRVGGLRHVVLNLYGGEALHHPNIVEILKQVRERHQAYQDRWSLTVTTTTNAIVSDKKLQEILPLIDEFTVSYHTEASDKQKQQFRHNVLTIKNSPSRVKCVVLMHNGTELFADAQNMIDWLNSNGVRALPRQLDNYGADAHQYKPQQITWFNREYNQRSHGAQVDLPSDQDTAMSETGRACCGGRQICYDQNYRERNFFVKDNQFTGWRCSVNWFFLYVRQSAGTVFTNKDCRMNYDNEVGAIGTLENSAEILQQLKNHLHSNTLPVIECKKNRCLCGLCAPKAHDLETYKTVMSKYLKNYTL